ncbi:MAG: hypothetical protein M3Z82_07920 [Apilactobacillus sp.]|nr:hypothetical protein [Apilactobacillus sp.]
MEYTNEEFEKNFIMMKNEISDLWNQSVKENEEADMYSNLDDPNYYSSPLFDSKLEQINKSTEILKEMNKKLVERNAYVEDAKSHGVDTDAIIKKINKE